MPDAIRAAAAAGFDAVECHWPYDTPPDQVRAALTETGLPMLGLNTRPGEGFGLAALPGREEEARAAIDEAIAYARATGTQAIHVMAGIAAGPQARDAFIANLRHACAAAQGLIFLIEPLNTRDTPGYFLTSTDQARAIIEEVNHPALRLMFDCYHMQIMEGDVAGRLAALLPLIGHVQIAAVPDRGAPDHGDLDYARVFATLARLGYDRPLGAEYKVTGATEASLGWLARARSQPPMPE